MGNKAAEGKKGRKGKEVGLTASDIMQTQVVTISPDDPLANVRRVFVEEGISGAPVVDDQQRVLGVISMTDLLRAANEGDESEAPTTYYDDEGVEYYNRSVDELAELFDQRFRERPVSDFMSNGAVTVEPKASVAEVARTFRENRVHRVLVADQGILRGLISALDLVALLERDDPGVGA
jgi:CBS domain-containing protein